MNIKKVITLNNEKIMPVIGLGTYSRKPEKGQCKQAVLWGLEAGYRHIDAASVYGNEEEVGSAINHHIQQGLLKREDLFVTTKLWSDKHAEQDVLPALKQSLQRLQLDYVDLYLIHWPHSVNEKGEDAAIDYLETWKGMEAALETGLTKSIGVSNFNKGQLQRLFENSKVKPSVNQVEINPTLTQHELVNFCKDNSVVPVAYTPLGLISEARPEFAGLDVIKTDPEFEKLTQKYGKTRAQVALRYLIQRGIVVIPKSFTKSRIEENINLFDFYLTDEDMALVDSFNINNRCVPGVSFKTFKYYPF